MKAPETITPGIYARVSSDQQAKEQTIASQVDALRQRVLADGLALAEELCFLDEGHSGSTLLRPALERLRDQAAAGVIDRLYVHSPDRLARKYAYQVLLLDELKRCGVEVVFLNHDIDRSPEGDLLLQVQGMVAEYERAKILERSRRGKLHAARRGSLNVLGGAPYGYRYVSQRDSGGLLPGDGGGGSGGPAGLCLGWAGTLLARGGLPASEAAGHFLAQGQGFLGPHYGLGPAQEPGLQGHGGLW